MDFRKIIPVIMVGLMLFSISSCDEAVCTDCNPLAYAFRDSIAIAPNNETISQGDTLWFNCTIPINHLDISSNKNVSFPNATNLSIVFDIQRILVKNNADYSLLDFDAVIKHGKMLKHFLPEGALECLFEETSTNYLYQVGLVPKKGIAKGIYFVFFSQTNGVSAKDKKSANIELGFKVKNQHLDLYYDNMPDRILYPQFAKLTYCFGVAE